MTTSYITDRSITDRFRCAALADEIIAEIPGHAEARHLSPGEVALALWLALYCDLLGNELTPSVLFELAHRAAAESTARQSEES